MAGEPAAGASATRALATGATANASDTGAGHQSPHLGPAPVGPGSRWGRAAWMAARLLAVLLPLAFLSLFFIWPVLSLLGRGFFPPISAAEAGQLAATGATPPWWDRLDLTGLQQVLTNPRTWRLVRNTLSQALVGTAFSVLLGVPTAYLLYRVRFPGRMALRGLITVPFVLPSVVVGIAFHNLLRPGGLLEWLGWHESFAAVVVSMVFFNYSVVVRTVGGLWERLDSRSEQAARSLGASPARAWWTVTLPALAPAIASAAAVVFLFCATAFGVVMVLGGPGYHTVETEIYLRTTQFLDLRTASVLSLVQLAVVALALWLAGRARRSREVALSLGSHRQAAPRLSLRRASHSFTAASTALTVGLLLILPMAGMLARSLQDGQGNWTLANFAALGTTGGQHSALMVTVWQAAWTSLRAAALATALALTIGGLISLVLSRRPAKRSLRRAISLFDAVMMLPLGVSAVTVGFGFLITLDRPLGLNIDLRTSGVLIPIAQAVVAIPLVVRTVLPVLRAIDPRLRQASASLGATPARVIRDVDIPLAIRSVGLAIGFAFAVSLGEFGATSFLARPQDPTLPVVIFRLLGRPGVHNYGMALAASVVLALLTALVMVAAESLRADASSRSRVGAASVDMVGGEI